MIKKILISLCISFILLFIFYLILDKKFDEMEANKIIIDNEVDYIVRPTDVYNLRIDYYNDCETESTSTSCYNIDMYTLEEKKMTEEKINASIKCLEHIINEDNEEYCSKVNLVVDNKISIDMDTIYQGVEDNDVIVFKTDNYYVIKQYNAIYGLGILNIYSSNGELVKEISNTIRSYATEDAAYEEVYEVSINNNKLYYAYIDEKEYVDGIDNFVHIGYIDLNKEFNFIELKKIKAIPFNDI